MAKIEQTKIFIQYGNEGDIGPFKNPIPKDDAGKFVALDSASGGYPYPVPIDRAHDFYKIGNAIDYVGSCPGLHIVKCRITYEWNKTDEQV